MPRKLTGDLLTDFSEFIEDADININIVTDEISLAFGKRGRHSAQRTRIPGSPREVAKDQPGPEVETTDESPSSDDGGAN